MSLKASECRKFAPNIFNRSKCQNCFRGKDAHSPEALESNRATRKVSCCGYLFVAPDWDFSLAANRNKRWQRRWFVLYDDGELAYSVDEHPETVPQSVIDMTRVLEVADAEGVTGNPFALALTCPDKVHFVKGTSREETKKWFEVLSKFPRNTVCGKYKRNATFPCIIKPIVKMETPVVRRDTVDGFSSKPRIQSAFDPGDDLYPTKDTNSSSQEKKKQELQNESMCLREESKMYLVMSDVPKKILEQPFRKTVEKWEELKGRTIHKSASVPDTALLREDTTHQVRGDPDGCNPDSLPPSSPPDFPPDDQFLKKGWLVKQQGEGGGWSKHWFVLRNCALAFYTDPIAEEAGVMDGVIDLRQVRDVTPHDPPSSSSSFTFCIQMKDSSRLLLSAVSAKIRSHWVRALASTTAPPSPPPARNALSRVKARSATRNHRPTPSDTPPKQEDECVAAKERLEEASWAIWLDVAKFCRGGAEGEGIARVEERLQAVQAELDKAKGEHTTPVNSSSGGLVRRCSDGGETVRRLQTQVRAAQAQADCLELWAARARAAAAQAERLHVSQMALMAARVEDLTAKLLAAERQVRQLRQRVAKLETRRRSSLKGKEALTLSKEYEAKLSELEGKIEGLLGGAEEEEVSRDSLLARLHALDRRVTDAMPKIRLQVESSEDKWNSLSLSTSMTDLSTPPSPEELWEELVSRVASLEAWVRSNLQTDHLPSLSSGCCPERSLSWLQDAASDLYRQAHFQQYRSRVVVCHLRRLELALEGLELFMEQHPPTLSLCALMAARLSSSSQEEECRGGEEEAELWRRVEERRERVRSLLSSFKGRSLERLCAALRELAEEAQATQQAHFLQHVVAQVATSFTQHTARSLFPWLGEEGAGAAQGALAQLSLELRELRALPPGGCGVLLEYARCAVGQLARVVAVAAMAEAAAEQLNSRDFASTCRGVGGVGVVSLCDPDELGVSHRSVSSLLCFKRKWKDKQHCRSCTELRQEVSYLQGELEESRAVSGALCDQTEALRAQQEMQFNEEKKMLEKDLQTAKNNLKKIELHYDEEVGRLQQEYEAKLQQKNDELSRENSKLLFATEMEQLKGVCERGLSALDAAHGKALCELERRHQRELHEMANERQRALADEARATALALEAVRNAHSEELKKQMQSFKEEFVLKMNKKLETEAFKKCYEADLGAMKCEIMSMTEKYSVKCLENATLHEKLEVMNQQLKSTTTQVVDLLARNQQLRARLTSAQIQKQEESVQ